MRTIIKITSLLLAAWLSLQAGAPPRPGATPRLVHVYVALCDNEHQGIVPVPPSLGNGEDPARNLYWGALYGVKTHFKRSGAWKLLLALKNPSPAVLERCVFKHNDTELYLVADAYRGRDIKAAVVDFLQAAAGSSEETIFVPVRGAPVVALRAAGGSGLVAYLGHDGLMDFSLGSYPGLSGSGGKPVFVLACLSRTFFADALKAAGARPVVWTTGLLAPEAYVLKAAVESWGAGEKDEVVAGRAAEAYHRYQKCGLKAAKKLLVTGW